jgi:integrase
MIRVSGKRPGDAQTSRARHRKGCTFDAGETVQDEELEMSDFVPVKGQRGFYRRANGAVYFRFRDPRGRYRWGPACATVREAQARKAALVTDSRRGEYQQRSRETYASYSRSALDTYRGRTGRGVRAQTVNEYRERNERYVVPYFGSMRLSEIEHRDVKEFVLQLERSAGLAAGTIRQAVAPLRAVLATAVDEGVLRSNPVAGLRLHQPRTQVRALSAEELAALLALVKADAPAWWPFFAFLSWSGLRIGEAVELRWGDVDLERGVLQVERQWYRGRVGPPKSEFGKRTLGLSPLMARRLLFKRGRSADAHGLVWTGKLGGRVSSIDLARTVLKPAREHLGMEWVTFKTFRHTCATMLFREGWNAVQVQRWLGHHKPSFTLDTYVHLLEEDVPVPDLFDELLGQVG